MKQYIYIAYLICFTIGLVSCQENDSLTEKDGYGYLQVSSIEMDKNIIPQSKASGSTLALDILQGDNLIKHVDDWTTLKTENIVLPVGQYLVKAYPMGQEMSQGLEAKPYYQGEANVNIQKDVAQNVSITCTLAQSMVSVTYTDRFKAAFTAYQCVVSNGDFDVTFAPTETKAAYFISGGALNAALSLTNAAGTTGTHNQVITNNAEKRFHYKLNYDVEESENGEGSFEITVDPTTKQYNVTLTVPIPNSKLKALRANAWGKFAYLYGKAETDDSTTDPVKFTYRKQGTTDWTTVGAALSNEVDSAKTNELDFATTYEYRIMRGNKFGNTETFTTESFQEIPNLDFETWIKSGKNWFANSVAGNYEETGAYWATGNQGVTSGIGSSANTTPVEDDVVKGKAAKLQTVEVNAVIMKVMAAGNLFIGKYKTVMTDPKSSVTFGRPYSGARPVSLSGWYKYTPKNISNGGSIPGHLTTDQCHIYLQLKDELENVIGYGEFVGTETVDSYTKFNFDIEYSDPIAKPAEITIVATSSRYGGEFSGTTVIGQVGKGSTLWVDEFELSYYK